MSKLRTIGKALLYTGTAACFIAASYPARDYWRCLTDPQFLAEATKIYYRFEPAAGRAAAGLITLGAIGVTAGLVEDWNSIKNFVGQAPNKVSSKVINPAKEYLGRHLRRNANYLATYSDSDLIAPII